MPNAVVTTDADGQVITRGGTRNMLLNAWLSAPHNGFVFPPSLAALREFRQPAHGLPVRVPHVLLVLIIGRTTVESM
jgi:hypothetical protein